MRSSVSRVFVIAASVATAAGGSAAAAEADVVSKEMPIYGTSLAQGWQNWSWAKTELSVELKGSARKPIKVEAGPWAALYLHHDAFNTTGLQRLTLLLQGSAPDEQVRIFALTDGKVVGEGHLVAIGNAGWTQVDLPLASIAADDKVIDGIWVQNATGTDLPRFYVTEIKLK